MVVAPPPPPPPRPRRIVVVALASGKGVLQHGRLSLASSARFWCECLALSLGVHAAANAICNCDVGGYAP